MLIYKQLGTEKPPLPGLPAWFSRVLQNRGIDTAEKAARFLSPSLDRMDDPFLFPDMQKAVSLIREAIAGGERICIYGDYDVDGISACSILLLQLRGMGADVGYRIPKRSEGYGMNLAAMDELAAQGVRLLITVDCGITNAEEVARARTLGMRVIVTDHHELGEKLPAADALINPKIGYPFHDLCGAGVALKICQALGGMQAVEALVDLASIATVADVVPLIGQNRAIVRAGMRKVDSTDRPGLAALRQVSQLKKNLTAEDIGYRLAPRLNAGGRLEDAAQCVQLLTCTDREKADALAMHLNELNSMRRAEQDAMLRAAEEQVRKWDFRTHMLIMVSGAGWNKGIIGLTAGRLCEKYHFPVIALSDDGEGQSVGSCRSIEGVHMQAVLTECARRYRDCNGTELFIRFGGHAGAAGLTIRTELKDELLRLLDLVIRQTVPDPACYIPVVEYDCTLHIEDITLQSIDLLEQLEPTGTQNPPPVFRCRAHVQSMKPTKTGEHLQVWLAENGSVRRGMAFNMAHLASQPLQETDALLVPVRNDFSGDITAEFRIRSLRPAAGRLTLPDEAMLDASLEKVLTTLAARLPDDFRAERITDAALKQLLQAEGGRGTLMISYDRSRLAAYAETGADSAVGAVSDPRGFNTVLGAMDPDRLTDCWQRAVLLDGDVIPGLASLIRERCPQLPVLCLQPDPVLRQRLASLVLDRAALGRLYLAVRRCTAGLRPVLGTIAAAAELTPLQAAIGLNALQQAGLAEYAPSPFRVRLLTAAQGQKLTENEGPQNSPLIKWLRAVSEPGQNG